MFRLEKKNFCRGTPPPSKGKIFWHQIWLDTCSDWKIKFCQGTSPPPGITRNCYGHAAGGMPLAFSQEVFLVLLLIFFIQPFKDREITGVLETRSLDDFHRSVDMVYYQSPRRLLAPQLKTLFQMLRWFSNHQRRHSSVDLLWWSPHQPKYRGWLQGWHGWKQRIGRFRWPELCRFLWRSCNDLLRSTAHYQTQSFGMIFQIWRFLSRWHRRPNLLRLK